MTPIMVKYVLSLAMVVSCLVLSLSQAEDQPLSGPPDMLAFMEIRPQGAEKLALILSDASAELARMDRYERRALSRRKFAIRDFDAAR